MIDFIAGCAMGAFITWAVRRLVSAARRKRVVDLKAWRGTHEEFERAIESMPSLIDGGYVGAGRSLPHGNLKGPVPPKK